MGKRAKDNGAYKAPIDQYRKEIGNFNRKISEKMDK